MLCLLSLVLTSPPLAPRAVVEAVGPGVMSIEQICRAALGKQASITIAPELHDRWMTVYLPDVEGGRVQATLAAEFGILFEQGSDGAWTVKEAPKAAIENRIVADTVKRQLADAFSQQTRRLTAELDSMSYLTASTSRASILMELHGTIAQGMSPDQIKNNLQKQENWSRWLALSRTANLGDWTASKVDERIVDDLIRNGRTRFYVDSASGFMDRYRVGTDELKPQSFLFSDRSSSELDISLAYQFNWLRLSIDCRGYVYSQSLSHRLWTGHNNLQPPAGVSLGKVSETIREGDSVELPALPPALLDTPFPIRKGAYRATLSDLLLNWATTTGHAVIADYYTIPERLSAEFPYPGEASQTTLRQVLLSIIDQKTDAPLKQLRRLRSQSGSENQQLLAFLDRPSASDAADNVINALFHDVEAKLVNQCLVVKHTGGALLDRLGPYPSTLIQVTRQSTSVNGGVLLTSVRTIRDYCRQVAPRENAQFLALTSEVTGMVARDALDGLVPAHPFLRLLEQSPNHAIKFWSDARSNGTAQVGLNQLASDARLQQVLNEVTALGSLGQYGSSNDWLQSIGAAELWVENKLNSDGKGGELHVVVHSPSAAWRRIDFSILYDSWE